MQTLHFVTCLVGIKSLFSFATTVMPPFFGTTCTGLTHLLSEIGYITPASRSLMTSSLTTSFIIGLSRLCGCTIGLTFSSNKILCMQSAGLIALIAPIVQPKADLCPFSTRRSFSSCKEVSVLLIITGFFLSSSRKTYFRGGGSCLTSSFLSFQECSS